MSDTSATPNTTANADTEQALSRLAAFGNEQNKGISWGPLVMVLVLLLPLAAAGALAWLHFGLQSELDALRADNATLQQLSAGSTNQVAQLQERQQELDTTLQQDLAAANATLTAQTAQLATLATELASTRLRVNAMDAGGSPLAEAEVLLRFAQQRLLLARDTVTAINLFFAADELLSVIDDPAIFSLRDILAREVAQLQALPLLDVPGLFARLNAQAARIENFTVVSSPATQDLTVTPSVETEPVASGWWNSMKQFLNNYFVVTRSTAQILPQLDAGEQFLVRSLVRLHIEQAKLALLRAEPALYQSALDEALVMSRQWLQSADGSFAEFEATLETLRATPIVVDIPPLGDTLAALKLLPGIATAPVAPQATAEPAAQPESPSEAQL